MEKASWAYFESQIKKFFRNSRTSCYELIVSLNNICSPSVVKEIKRINSYFLLFKDTNEGLESGTKILHNRIGLFSKKICIDREYNHSFIGFLASAYHEMPPKTLVYLRIIGRQTTPSRKFIKYMEESICHLISENTIGTINNTIKLGRSMESKTIFCVDSFSSRNVFSPTKFYLVTVTIYFWGCLNRMPFCLFDEVWYMMKYLSYLLFFYFCLFFVGDWEPSTSAIHLKVFWQYLFKRGFLDHIEYLSFYTVRTVFHHPDIYNTSWYRSTRNNNFLTRNWISSQSGTSEDEFFNGDM